MTEQEPIVVPIEPTTAVAPPPPEQPGPVVPETAASPTQDALQEEVKYSMLNPELKPIRRIIADDLEWSLHIVPPLTDLALNSIVKSFDTSPTYEELMNKHREQLLKSLPTDVPLKVTAPLIEDEDYWKRCCKEKWSICDTADYDGSWKRMYFEKNIEEIIENFVPAKSDTKALFEYVDLGTVEGQTSFSIDQ